MSKAQSFGFDVLLVLITVLLFGEVLYLQSNRLDSSLLMQRRVENNQLLYLTLKYNNSLSYLNLYACESNARSLEEFNETINHVLSTYVTNREYLLVVNGLVYSSEGVNKVCLEEASPVYYSLNSTCGNNLNLEFSIYTQEEKRVC